MSDFDSIRFQSGFTIPNELEYAGRPSFLRGVGSAYGPGLFKVVFAIEDRKTRSHTPFDTMFLEDVEDDDDEPNISEDDFGQILLARIFDHNKDVRQKIRYAMKVSYRGRGKNAKTIYETLIVDEEYTPQIAPPRTPIEFIDADEESPGLMFMQHLGQMLGEMRLFQQEMRLDVRASRDYSDKVIGKIIEVVGNQVQHSNNQAHAAQAGWDALHTGLDMTKKHHEEMAELRATVQAQSFELAMLKTAEKKEKRNELVAGVLPAGLLAAGKTLTDKGSAFGPLLTGLASMATGGGQAPQAPPPTEEAPAPNGANKPNGTSRTIDANIIDEVDTDMTLLCSADEIASLPSVCLARTLKHSLGMSQKKAIHSILTPEEWNYLNAALDGNDAGTVSQNLMAFFISFQNRDEDQNLYKKLAARLSLFQRNLIKDISDYAMGGAKPIDVNIMKTSAWKKPRPTPAAPPPTPQTAPPTTPRPDTPAASSTPSPELDEIKKTLEAATAALQESRRIQEAQAQKITEIEQQVIAKNKPRSRKKTPTKNPKS